MKLRNGKLFCPPPPSKSPLKIEKPQAREKKKESKTPPKKAKQKNKIQNAAKNSQMKKTKKSKFLLKMEKQKHGK